MTIIRVVRNLTAGTFTPESDWQLRSTAAGVFYRNNFTYKNAAETQLITNQADLYQSAFEYQVAEEDLMDFDTNHKITGNGSLRLNMAAARPGDYANYGLGWDGIGLQTKNTHKHKFYFQFGFYADSVYRNTYFGDGFGGKIAIFQAPDRSFGSGEVVLRRDHRPGGWLFNYRIASGIGALAMRLFYSSLSRRANYAFLDRGTPAVTTINTLQQRHGPETNASDATGDDADFQHAPRLVENGWTTLEVYIDLEAQVCKMWSAPYGEAPTLIMGGMDYEGNAYLGLPAPGTSDGGTGELYSGVQLTIYSNWNQTAHPWTPSDTFVCYDECIASDDPIPFPGGHELQFPGIEIPTGWPPSGSEPV